MSEILMKTVCEICDVDEASLKTRVRSKGLSDARKTYYYLAYKLYGKSHEELAKVFGRDRTAVLHALKCCGDLIKFDKLFRNRVELAERVVIQRMSNNN